MSFWVETSSYANAIRFHAFQNDIVTGSESWQYFCLFDLEKGKGIPFRYASPNSPFDLVVVIRELFYSMNQQIALLYNVYGASGDKF